MSAAAVAPARVARRSPAELGVYGLIGAASVALVVFALTTHGFATVDNVKAVLFSVAFVGTVAMGQTLIMISGSFFSLSLGTATAVSAIVFIWAMQWGTGTAIVVALLFGAAVGGLQGFAVGAWDTNPIILTIAAGVILQGLTLTITGGSTVRPDAPTALLDALASPIAGIPFAFYAFVGVTIVVQLLLLYTRSGASIYLVGESPEAARAAGLPVTRFMAAAFAGAGACAAVAGITLGAFQGSATLSLEGTLTFDAIAAALIGGSAVEGGRGSALRTFVGAIGIAALSSALLLRGYSTGVQIAVKGAIVIVAVLIVHVLRQRTRS